MNEQKPAVDGGGRAVRKLGPFPTKIGREELLEIMSMWRFSPENQEKLKNIIDSERHLKGPHLFRYYNYSERDCEAIAPGINKVLRKMLKLSFTVSPRIADFRSKKL